MIAVNPQKFQSAPAKPKNTTYNQLLQAGQASNPKSRADQANAQPYWLTLGDRKKPIAFLQETLSLENLKHLRLGLQEWLEDGLIETSCLADTLPCYGFALYKQLHMIFEASHLLVYPPTPNFGDVV